MIFFYLLFHFKVIFFQMMSRCTKRNELEDNILNKLEMLSNLRIMGLTHCQLEEREIYYYMSNRSLKIVERHFQTLLEMAYIHTIFNLSIVLHCVSQVDFTSNLSECMTTLLLRELSSVYNVEIFECMQASKISFLLRVTDPVEVAKLLQGKQFRDSRMRSFAFNLLPLDLASRAVIEPEYAQCKKQKEKEKQKQKETLNLLWPLFFALFCTFLYYAFSLIKI
jgi:hypothetical protein